MKNQRINFPNLILVSIFCLVAIVSNGQSSLKNGMKSYKNDDFGAAYAHFSNIKNLDDPKYLILRGISAYEIGKLDDAVEDFEYAKNLESKDLDLYLNLAKTYHSLMKFEMAIDHYKQYLKLLPRKKAVEKHSIIKLIKECGNGIQLSYRSSDFAVVEHLPGNINSKGNEINPLISPNYSNKLYFSRQTIDQPTYDMMAAQFSDEWKISNSVFHLVNTKEENEILQDFSSDGSVMVYLRGNDKEENQIIINNYVQDQITERVLFSTVKGINGDQDIYLVDDNVIIFSSKTIEDGFGGYDLYYCKHTEQGWSEPKNMGSSVNSKYDERTPCMNPAKNTLFFSSNRPSGVGGYDVYVSNKENKKWQKPYNLGVPLNSPEDDVYFKMSDNGLTAYFSSNRKAGKGQFDIYAAYLQNQYNFNPKFSEEPVALLTTSVFSKSFKLNDSNEKEVEKVIAIEEEVKTQNIEAQDEKVDQEDITQVVQEVEELDVNDSLEENIEIVEHEEVIPKVETVEKIKVEREGQGYDESVSEVDNSQKDEHKNSDSDLISVESNLHNKSNNSFENVPVEDEEMQLEPLLYKNNDDILTPENQMVLDKVMILLQRFPQSKVVLTCHSQKEGLPEYELFFTIRRVNKAAAYLEEIGIEKDRIIRKTVGSYYPYIAEINDPAETGMYRELNSRIDVKLININPGSVFIKYKQPQVDKKYKGRKYKLYQTLTDDLFFRVKIMSSNTMYKNAVLRYYNDLCVEQDPKSKNLNYLVGLYPSFQEAYDLKNKLQTKNLEGLKVIAYYNDQEITSEEADFLKGKYPDLESYLEYLSTTE